MKRAIDRAVELATPEKTQTALAHKLGVRPQTVQHWCATGVVPIKRAPEVEAACGGKVTRQELRPDFFGQPANAA